MRVEGKRIFISDLPETATQEEVENAFKNYGNIISIEIKERKELGPKNTSLFFAYVNIDIDDRNLQQCFKDFSNEKWHGRYVILQIARESFLDRLKRERSENENKAKDDKSLEKVSKLPQQILERNIPNGIKKDVAQKYKSSSESESSYENSSNSEDEKERIRTPKEKKVKSSSSSSSSSSSESNEGEKSTDLINETLDLIIKNNKGKVFDKNGLKIESVGNKPIIKIDKSKKKEAVNSSEANLKRLQSLSKLKKGYQTQKSLIQAALSKVDSNSKSKIIFDENIKNISFKKSRLVDNKQSRISLFDDDPNEEEFEANFNLKEQFQGKEGKKLLELQSKYKNDKRFLLDKRFLDKNETAPGENINGEEENEEISLQEEKKKEYEILEQVLGKKVIPKSLHQKELQRKAMVRFDPTQPEHSKFEIKKELGKQKKRKKNDSQEEIHNEKNRDEKEVPVVSKEIFYKVTDSLKDSLQENQEFSLLSMFGKKDERGERNIDESYKQLDGDTNSILMGKNPFRYDCSDDETDNVNKDQHVEKSLEPVQTKINRTSFWSEPFFFKNDDYRLQEGFDFIEKMKSEEKTEFTKLRRDLKEIVKAKVRNNQRKHKPFKKKLGGNKRKKMIKMKKALKR